MRKVLGIGLVSMLVMFVIIFAVNVSDSVIGDHYHSEDKLEHGGGLDKCGGHNNRKTGGYHYHRGPYCNDMEQDNPIE